MVTVKFFLEFRANTCTTLASYPPAPQQRNHRSIRKVLQGNIKCRTVGKSISYFTRSDTFTIYIGFNCPIILGEKNGLLSDTYELQVSRIYTPWQSETRNGEKTDLVPGCLGTDKPTPYNIHRIQILRINCMTHASDRYLIGTRPTETIPVRVVSDI